MAHSRTPYDVALDRIRAANPDFFAPPARRRDPGARPDEPPSHVAALAFRTLLLARRRVPLGHADLIAAAARLGVSLGDLDELGGATVCFGARAYLHAADPRASAHALYHALMHTWDTGIWVCDPTRAGPEERDAEAFARILLGEAEEPAPA